MSCINRNYNKRNQPDYVKVRVYCEKIVGTTASVRLGLTPWAVRPLVAGRGKFGIVKKDVSGGASVLPE